MKIVSKKEIEDIERVANAIKEILQVHRNTWNKYAIKAHDEGHMRDSNQLTAIQRAFEELINDVLQIPKWFEYLNGE